MAVSIGFEATGFFRDQVLLIGMHIDGTFVHPLANGIGKLPIVKRCPGGYRVEQREGGSF